MTITKKGFLDLTKIVESKLKYQSKSKTQESNPFTGSRYKGFKLLSKTEFKYVAKFGRGDEIIYKAALPNSKLRKSSWMNWYDTPREAAIAVDRKLLEFGLEPVNILKKKV